MPARGSRPKGRILVIDDELEHAEATAEALLREGYEVDTAGSGKEGLKKLQSEHFDVLVTDLVMEEMDGLEVLKQSKRLGTDVEVIVLTGHATVGTAVKALEEGAISYLTKPLNIKELRQKVKKALEKLQLSRDNVELRRQLEEKFGFEGIIGNTEKMHRIFDILKQVAPTDVTVLIQGESGTGKELIARAIHQNSRRRHHRFVALNCAALSEGILESELFGHEKGAFTGALYQRKGRFEFAHKGTLFLDEIGDMPLSTQIKLLRVIEEREIYRVGSNVPIPVDVRLIAATNQNLDELVKEGKFREDLYYRLKVVTINLPPLRERLADIPLLISHFIKEFNARHGKNVQSMSPRARDLLFLYPWPGNIRELRNCIESMVVTCKGRELTVDDIPAYISPDKVPESPIPMLAGISLEKAEKELIKNTLAMVNGNREEAARILGIGERTLYRKLKRYNLA